MKVGSSSSTSGSTRSGGAKPAADGFRLPNIHSTAGSAPASSASSASGTSGVTAISALLALQGAGGGEDARPRALRKGRRLLDALDRLQVALLGEGPTQGHLSLLRRALADERTDSGDKGLDDVLNWAEVRVAVEAAKLEKLANSA